MFTNIRMLNSNNNKLIIITDSNLFQSNTSHLFFLVICYFWPFHIEIKAFTEKRFWKVVEYGLSFNYMSKLWKLAQGLLGKLHFGKATLIHRSDAINIDSCDSVSIGS